MTSVANEYPVGKARSLERFVVYIDSVHYCLLRVDNHNWSISKREEQTKTQGSTIESFSTNRTRKACILVFFFVWNYKKKERESVDSFKIWSDPLYLYSRELFQGTSSC